jgi:type IV pilus assembly protein PilQ
MTRTLRAAATAIAMAAVLVGTSGCSAVKKGNRVAAGSVASSPPQAAPPPAGTPGRSQVTQAAFNEDADGARIVVTSDAPLLYTSYEPRPDLLVVEMPGVRLADGFTAPTAGGSLVQSVRAEELDELGKRITRLSVEHQPGLRYELRSVGRGLAVAFEAPREPSATTETAGAAPAVAERDVTAEAAVAAPPKVTAEAIPAPELSRSELAHLLEEVTAENSAEGVAVRLLADGTIAARDFVLANPPRLVIDLPGVRNAVRRRVFPVSGGLVSRVRISQFQSAPDPITRIVLDLTRPAAYSLHADGERLSVVVGDAAVVAPPAEPPTTVPLIAEVGAPPTTPEVAPPAPQAAPLPARTEPEAPPERTAVAAAEPIAPPAQEPSAPSRTETFVSPPPESVPSASAAEARPAAELPPPAVPTARSRDARKAPSTEPKQPTAPEEGLFEAAAAVLAQQEPTQRAGELTAFQSRTLAEGATQFTGEPISLDLKDADIKDVFRTISQFTGLNIVIDPDVRGTVTVQLENVPWDQALDLILKQNGLGYVLENNIMRIATTQKLQAEELDRARLAEARQASEPTRTVIKKLSYARAFELTPTLKSIMSRRGDIVVDTRTNTLIIREIPTFLPAVLQLIDNLDTPTAQVMIEARIVETTKSLGRSLGINWGFSGVADVAHGNTTNLTFPNNIDGSFRVGLEQGPVIGQIRLGNILDTFNLDVSLTASENQGLLKIVSSPKLAALTNTAALIQSGVQIPVQTTVNNTTTVIYVDATLKLEVTPQVTAEGTILLTVAVQKREPAVALNLSLGNNVPLTIREYRGQVLVRDGGTTVIGGIFQINDQDQNNMIPGLWKIPILGNLFRNKTRTEKHDELLIFLTPRILR